MTEPALGLQQRRSVEPARYDAAAFAAPDQARDLKHVEMLEHRWQRHRKRLRQGGDREFRRLAKTSQHRAPGRIGQRRKDAVQAIGLIVNHKVKLEGKIRLVNGAPHTRGRGHLGRLPALAAARTGRDARARAEGFISHRYGGSPNLRRTASTSPSVGSPASFPRYWILCAAAARANRRCLSQAQSGLDK
jgi:hypothetical protein